MKYDLLYTFHFVPERLIPDEKIFGQMIRGVTVRVLFTVSIKEKVRLPPDEETFWDELFRCDIVNGKLVFEPDMRYADYLLYPNLTYTVKHYYKITGSKSIFMPVDIKEKEMEHIFSQAYFQCASSRVAQKIERK